MTNSNIMVIGGGISGIESALNLGEQGYRVILVEKDSSIGGRMAQLDKTFPTLDCSICILAPKMVEVARHPNIDLLTYSEVQEVSGEAGNFNVKVLKKSRYVDIEKCTGCGECIQQCSVQLPNEFNEGLDDRNAIYLQFPQAVPFKVLIDRRGVPPCKDACPAHVNAQGYVALISNKKYQEALNLIRERCPLPAVIGRICPHFCESVCNRMEVDEAINICGLKRFVADYVRENIKDEITFLEEKKDDKVAIIGSGPAGLTVAYHLAKRGYPVTIFEKESVAGGMLRLGIPDYRLPPEILESDIDHIKKHGVEIKLNSPIGPDLTLDDLKSQGYKAIFIAIGLHASRKMDFECLNTDDVIYGVDFLKNLNLSRDLPDLKDKIVGIVGGGDVAMDSARSAIRLGAKKVVIIYRRSEHEMPASREEIEMAREERIEFKFLTVPTKDPSGKKSNLTEIECIKMKLGEPDESGRRRPIAIEGSEFIMKIDKLIISIGQEPESDLIDEAAKKKLTNKWGYIDTNKVTYETNIPGVFAGGEIVEGAGSAIEAIATGNKAAIVIDKYLKGEELSDIKEIIPDYKVEEVITIADIQDIENMSCQERSDYTICLPEQRVYGFNEISVGGMDEDAALEEANRCLNCGGCCECFECMKACEADAIDFNIKDEIVEYNVASIIVATGIDLLDPAPLVRYHYGEFPNVITAMQYERLLSASGPTGGELLRPSDQKHAHEIAFIGCVGSRNEAFCQYCSKFCCMYMAKEGVVTREHAPDTNVTIFFNDTRVIGKNQEEFIERAKEEYKLKYFHGIPGDIREDPHTHDLLVKHANLDTGEVETARFNMVILASAVIPRKDSDELAKILGIEKNELGFYKTKNSVEDLQSTREGIYVTGSCQSPDDIANSVSKASGAAALAALHAVPLSEEEQRVELPPLRVVREGDEPRIGVFICHCGVNIGGYMDVPELVEYAKSLPNVVFAMDNKYSCSNLTQDIIKEKIDELDLNRVIVAACTPRTHEPLFQKTIREAGLNEYLFNFVSIRELDSWVHMNDREKATDKAKDLIRMGIARARFLKQEVKIEGDVVSEALVIGGGIAGLSAAMEIAKKGFKTHVVEKEDKLGGQLNLIYKINFDRIDSKEFLDDTLKEYNSLKNITTYLSSEVVDVKGSIGDFKVKVKNQPNDSISELNVGVIVVATGAYEYKPEGWYHYGEDPRIMTQLELSEKLRDNTLKDGETFVFIHCVASRQPEGGNGCTYCSLICCSESIRHALYIKENYPNSQVFVLYRDIRVGTDEEQYYWKARENVNYIRFNDYPEVDLTNGKINVSVHDILTQVHLNIEADKLVLSTPLKPYDNKNLAELLKVPRDQNGFFLEAHIKLRPVDFATDGIYLAGTAHGPKGIADAISQGRGAAAHALIPLTAGIVENEPLVSVVNPALCLACQKCEEVCNFGAIGVNFDNDVLVSESNPLLCKGCGDCAAACPAGAITMSHFADDQLTPMISEALRGEFIDERPRIVAFLCNWCSYAGADTCGVSRFQYPTNIRPIRVMCSGRIPKRFVLQAFLEGADGVFIGGCHLGDCHYLEGNYDTLQRYNELKEILEKVGINPERFRLEWVSASEGKRFSEVVTDFTNQVKKLGQIKAKGGA